MRCTRSSTSSSFVLPSNISSATWKSWSKGNVQWCSNSSSASFYCSFSGTRFRTNCSKDASWAAATPKLSQCEGSFECRRVGRNSHTYITSSGIKASLGCFPSLDGSIEVRSFSTVSKKDETGTDTSIDNDAPVTVSESSPKQPQEGTKTNKQDPTFSSGVSSSRNRQEFHQACHHAAILGQKSSSAVALLRYKQQYDSELSHQTGRNQPVNYNVWQKSMKTCEQTAEELLELTQKSGFLIIMSEIKNQRVLRQQLQTTQRNKTRRKIKNEEKLVSTLHACFLSTIQWCLQIHESAASTNARMTDGDTDTSKVLSMAADLCIWAEKLGLPPHLILYDDVSMAVAAQASLRPTNIKTNAQFTNTSTADTLLRLSASMERSINPYPLHHIRPQHFEALLLSMATGVSASPKSHSQDQRRQSRRQKSTFSLDDFSWCTEAMALMDGMSMQHPAMVVRQGVASVLLRCLLHPHDEEAYDQGQAESHVMTAKNIAKGLGQMDRWRLMAKLQRFQQSSNDASGGGAAGNTLEEPPVSSVDVVRSHPEHQSDYENHDSVQVPMIPTNHRDLEAWSNETQVIEEAIRCAFEDTLEELMRDPSSVLDDVDDGNDDENFEDDDWSTMTVPPLDDDDEDAWDDLDEASLAEILHEERNKALSKLSFLRDLDFLSSGSLSPSIYSTKCPSTQVQQSTTASSSISQEDVQDLIYVREGDWVLPDITNTVEAACARGKENAPLRYSPEYERYVWKQLYGGEDMGGGDGF